MKNEILDANRVVNRREDLQAVHWTAKTAAKSFESVKKPPARELEKENYNKAGNSRSKLNAIQYSFGKPNRYQLLEEKPLPFAAQTATRYDTCYSRDYFRFLMHKEQDSLILVDNFSKQKEVDVPNRLIIVDWLLEVQQTCDLSLNAWFLSMLLIDKYLAKHLISLNKFIKICYTSLLLSSKCEDAKAKSLDAAIIMKLAGDSLETDELFELEKELLDENMFKIGFVHLDAYMDKLMPIIQSNRNKRIFEMMCVMTVYYRQLCSHRCSHVVYSLLEILKHCDGSLIDRNGDFSNAQEYLGMAIVDKLECSEVTKKLGKMLLLVQMNSFEGLQKKYPVEVSNVRALLSAAQAGSVYS